MSITSEIARLRAAKADIKSAIEDKGVRVPDETAIDAYAEFVGEIEQGTSDFDWASIGYDEMPEELRADLEETAAVKAAWDAMPANRKSNIFANNRTLMYFPKDIDLSLLSNATNVFSGMYNLRTIPVGMDYSTILSGFRLLYMDYALRTLPSDFRLPSMANIGSMFYNCLLLESVPDDFLSHPENVTNADGTFQSCTSLLALPKCVCEMENVTTLYNFASGCSMLTEAVFTGNYGNLTTARNILYNCPNLTKVSFPLDMFKNVVDLQSTFQSCSNLVDFPEGRIDLRECTALGGIFYQCTSLRRLWLYIPKVTSLANLCYYCTNITWLRLDECNVALTANCINQCPLSADGVYNLVDSLADRTGKSALTCVLSATAKNNMTPETAALAASKNWTIA